MMLHTDQVRLRGIVLSRAFMCRQPHQKKKKKSRRREVASGNYEYAADAADSTNAQLGWGKAPFSSSLAEVGSMTLLNAVTGRRKRQVVKKKASPFVTTKKERKKIKNMRD